jgi:hypothetical protein
LSGSGFSVVTSYPAFFSPVIAARVVCGCQPSLPLIAATSAPALTESSRIS